MCDSVILRCLMSNCFKFESGMADYYERWTRSELRGILTGESILADQYHGLIQEELQWKMEMAESILAD